MQPPRTPHRPLLTRRAWTALLSAAPLASQTAPAPVSPAASPSLDKAIDGVRQVSARLANLEVSMNVEPAFAFKV